MAENDTSSENAANEVKANPEKQLQNLNTLITDTKKEAEEAKSLLVLCKQYEKDSKEIKEKIQSDKSEIDTNKGIVEQATKTTTETELKATQALEGIEKNLKSVEDNIQKMETAFTDFEKINAKILEPTSGLENTLKIAQDLKTQIETAKTEADTGLKQINDDLATWATRTQEMNEAFLKFQEIQKKVFDQETGLSSILTNAAGIRDAVLKLKNQSEGYDKKSKELTDNISTLSKKATDDSNRLIKTLNAVTTYGLGDNFNKRSESQKTIVIVWICLVIFSIILLAGAVVVFFGFSEKIGMNFPTELDTLSYVLYRIGLTSPFLFFCSFCISQYSKEKDLLERYSFKAAKGFTLETYTNTLTRTFNERNNNKENEAEIMKFVLEQMRNIYQEPFEAIKNSKHPIDSLGKAVNDGFGNTKRNMGQEENTSKENKA